MKRASVFLVVMVVFGFSLLHQGRGLAQRRGAQIPPNRVAPQAEITEDKVVSSQQRINRYFHSDVVPKLKDCWRGVQGNGAVEFEYNFSKIRGGRWTFDRVTTGETSLPAGEAAKALRCMQTAVRGTSFAATTEDGDQRSFTLHWNWPVPYPTNADALKDAMFRMSATSGGGTEKIDCDGRGTAPKCLNCNKGNCKKVCVGHKTCTVYSSGPFYCSASGACSSGGPFGVSGASRVIF